MFKQRRSVLLFFGDPAYDKAPIRRPDDAHLRAIAWIPSPEFPTEQKQEECDVDKKKDNDELALATYNQGIQIAPTYTLLYVNRMYLMFYGRNDYKSALADYGGAVGLGYKVDPDFAKQLQAKALALQ
jgi:hypothetical protein